jgi:hypothetical protein
MTGEMNVLFDDNEILYDADDNIDEVAGVVTRCWKLDGGVVCTRESGRDHEKPISRILGASIHRISITVVALLLPAHAMCEAVEYMTTLRSKSYPI